MKSIEFLCGHCGAKVASTCNHCPVCLWSKHTYGMRGKSCQALMRPVGITLKEDQCKITHRCERCGHESRRRTAVQDRFEALSCLSINTNEACEEPTAAAPVQAKGLESV